MLSKIILRALKKGGTVMDRTSRSSLFNLLRVLSVVFLLLTSLAYAEEKPEDKELAAVLVKITQLQQRLDQNSSDYEALRDLGIAYHNAALKDSKAYAKKAIEYLEKAHAKKMDDNVVLCYLGSAYTLLAKDASNRMDRMSFVNKGVEYMDKAARKDPDNIAIRMTRANNSKSLPKFLNRRPIAYEDFEHLADLFQKDLRVPSPLKISVYHSLAALYKEDGDVAKAQKYQTMAETVQKEK
jgi:tetratricopeptide (TPR) repeat protein